jgi:hypothetical protein
MRFLETMDGLIAASTIVQIEEEDTPAENKSVWYRKVHFRYTSTETRTVWARPEDVDEFLTEDDA